MADCNQNHGFQFGKIRLKSRPEIADLLNMKRISFEIILIVCGLTTMVLFQNCSGGMVLNGLGSGSNSQNSTSNVHPAVDFGFQSSGTTVTQSQLTAQTDYDVTFIGDTASVAQYHFAIDPSNNSASCSFTLGSVASTETLRCQFAGSSAVTVSVVWTDGSSQSQQKILTFGVVATTPTPSGSAAPTATPIVITFSIASGVGTGSWNTSASPVLAFVGQTLRITNNDTVAHQMHTSNDVPCPHQPAKSATGEFYDCLIANEHLNIMAGDIYEHLVGSQSPFFIKTLDGTAIYNSATRANCASCHGTLPNNSTKLNQSFQNIKNAIATVPQMMSISALQSLSDDEIHAIEYALKH